MITKISIIVFLCLLCDLSFAQYNVTEMTNGVVYSRSFGVDNATTVYSDIQLYKMFVPTTVKLVNFTGLVTSQCSSPVALISGGRGLPCGISPSFTQPLGISFLIPCYNYLTLNFSTGNTTFLFGPEDNTAKGISDFQVGTWWFFALRKNSIDYNATCDFDFTVTYTTCPDGQVGVGSASDDTIACIPTYTAPTDNWFTTVQVNNTSPVVYQVDYANEIDSVIVEVNTTDPNLSIVYVHCFGSNWKRVQAMVASTNAGGSPCSTHTANNNQYTVTCYSIPAGLLFISLSTASSSNFEYLMRVTANTCAAGFSGVNCESELIAFYPNHFYDLYLGTSTGPYSSHVFYMDIPPNSTSSYVIDFSHNGGSASAVVSYKKGAFAFDVDISNNDQHGFLYTNDAVPLTSFEPVTFYFRNEDTYEGGRYYFTVTNIGSESLETLNYTVNLDDLFSLLDISFVSGEGETTAAGTDFPIPLVVQVVSPLHGPITGFPIEFSITSGDVSFPSGITSVTVLSEAGNATAPTLIAGDTAPGTARATCFGNNQTQAVNQTFPSYLEVRVADQFSNYALGTVTFTCPSSGPSCRFLPNYQTSIISLIDGFSGLALAQFSANTIPGFYFITATYNQNTTVNTTIYETNVAGPGAMISIISGDFQSTLVGDPFPEPLSVLILDPFSNPVPNFPVTFRCAANNGSTAWWSGIYSYNARTNVNGTVTSYTLTANSNAGSYLCSVNSTAGYVSFNLSNIGPAGIVISAISGNDQSVYVNSEFEPLVVMVTNYGVPEVGLQLIFYASSYSFYPSCTFSGVNQITVSTNDSGIATVDNVVANSEAGGYSVAVQDFGGSISLYLDLSNKALPTTSTTAATSATSSSATTAATSASTIAGTSATSAASSPAATSSTSATSATSSATVTTAVTSSTTATSATTSRISTASTTTLSSSSTAQATTRGATSGSGITGSPPTSATTRSSSTTGSVNAAEKRVVITWGIVLILFVLLM